MMKKVLSWVMFATLICGNMLLMSCSDDNDNSGHEQPTLSECTIIFTALGAETLMPTYTKTFARYTADFVTIAT